MNLDLASEIIAYENGELTDEAIVLLFSHLVITGLAWQLQGHYGRTAVTLMEAGLLTPNGEVIDVDA